jgi:hypothetical protein
VNPVMPTGLELPPDVKAVVFTAPEGMEDTVQDIQGLVHLAEDGSPLGFEFMFELSKQELQVLRHEPYLTVSFMGQSLTPFRMETTVPFDEKYETLSTHSHICSENLTHDTQLWWPCDNPAHNTDTKKLRTCKECFHVMWQRAQEEGDDTDG